MSLRFLISIINCLRFEIVLLGSDPRIKKVALLLNDRLTRWELADPSFALPGAMDSIQSNIGYKRI